MVKKSEILTRLELLPWLTVAPSFPHLRQQLTYLVRDVSEIMDTIRHWGGERAGGMRFNYVLLKEFLIPHVD